MSGILPSAEEKPRFVEAMFGRIAERYDLMNTLMTMGMDRGWRETLAGEVRPPSGSRVLDVGAGTGKLAQAIARTMDGGLVVAADFTLPMMLAGRPSVATSQVGGRVVFAAADARWLPFADGELDVVVSAFLVRNLPDVRQGLREQARVLRAGGRLAVLEITPGPPNLLRPLYRLYFRRVVPALGRLIAGDPTAYTYLPESAAAFLEPDRLAALVREVGLTDVRQRRLALGTVALTTGTKPGG